MDLVKRLITEAPVATSFRNDKPSLLVSWWCTVYAFAIILVRLGGRYVRAEKVFLEDAIMMGAIIPLLIRMGFVQIVLSHGTNNTVTDGLSNFDISKRELGSQMVMASRVFYAVYLWTIKYSVSVFLKTLTASVWQRSHAKILRYLHIFLGFTFIATVVADLSSCQPFSHNWQVVPDPGSKCRQNYAHLITTGSMDALTNLVLVVFPMPMILSSSLPRKHKFTIVLRLALPLLPIILTAWTIPKILAHAGFQPYRSLLASFSILLTTFSSNAVVLTSLLQDKGYKKSKFKHVIEIAGKGSGTPGLDRDGKNRMSYVEEGWMDSDDELIVQSNKMVREGVEMGVLRRDEVGRGVLAEPKRAKLGEIKVASSWEISVDERGSHGG